MPTPLRVIFMGTAELACESLKALHSAPACQVIAVVTQPDKPRGRDLKLQPSAVKEVATRENLPVLQPNRARSPEFIAALSDRRPDLMVVAAYGQILPQAILDIAPHGCLNVHTSLLPKYRGAAPIQFAILNGDEETGVTIMQMDAGMDTGDILTRAVTPITPEDNAQTLHDRLASLGAELLVKTIPDLVAGNLQPRPQDSQKASYTRKITKEDGHIDWDQSAPFIWNQVRGLTPWPGAFTHRPRPASPSLLKIWGVSVVEESSGTPGTILAADKSGLVVACGKGALRIDSLQLEGRRRMDASQFLAGTDLPPGTQLLSGPAPDFSAPNRHR